MLPQDDWQGPTGSVSAIPSLDGQQTVHLLEVCAVVAKNLQSPMVIPLARLSRAIIAAHRVLYKAMGLLGPSMWKQPMLWSSGRRPGGIPLPPRVLTRQASSNSLKAASGSAGGLLDPGSWPGPATRI